MGGDQNRSEQRREREIPVRGHGGVDRVKAAWSGEESDSECILQFRPEVFLVPWVGRERELKSCMIPRFLAQIPGKTESL